MKGHPLLNKAAKLWEHRTYITFEGFACPVCSENLQPDPAVRGGFAARSSALGKLNRHLWDAHPPKGGKRKCKR